MHAALPFSLLAKRRISWHRRPLNAFLAPCLTTPLGHSHDRTEQTLDSAQPLGILGRQSYLPGSYLHSVTQYILQILNPLLFGPCALHHLALMAPGFVVDLL